MTTLQILSQLLYFTSYILGVGTSYDPDEDRVPAITTTDELTTLGICLGCDPNDVRRLKNGNPSLKDAAYEILCFLLQLCPKRREVGNSEWSP